MLLSPDYLPSQSDPTTHEADQQLIQRLQEKTPPRYDNPAAGLSFANETIAAYARESYTQDELAALEAHLHEVGTLTIPVTQREDSTGQQITFVGATELDAHHGEMSTMLYLRDHIQAASVLMDLFLRDPEHYTSEGVQGRELLFSALHLMSTPPQLARFENVIEQQGTVTQEEWPHISLWFNDLDGKEANGWRNKQDTFQMLAYTTFDAIDRGFIDVDQLTDAHKQFLGSIVPLLSSIGFPHYESSGSWEEITARRTSVMAIETALLDKIKTLSHNNLDFQFLTDTYDKSEISMYVDFETAVATMRRRGLEEIGRRLPDESPDYTHDSIKYRTADASLTYVLMYGLPKLLVQEGISIGAESHAAILNEESIENIILDQLRHLDDPVTNGINRYHDDSYQGPNFHTKEVQMIIDAIKRKVKDDAKAAGQEIDLDAKQALRGQLTPRGRSASWTHPLGQISAWAARRSIETTDENQTDNYRALSTHFLNRMLSTITGDNQWHATLNSDNQYELELVPKNRLPECYVTYIANDGASFTVPSPHTPLNWSSATLRHATGLARISIR